MKTRLGKSGWKLNDLRQISMALSPNQDLSLRGNLLWFDLDQNATLVVLNGLFSCMNMGWGSMEISSGVCHGQALGKLWKMVT